MATSQEYDGLRTDSPKNLQRNFLGFTTTDIPVGIVLAVLVVFIAGLYGRMAGLVALIAAWACMYRFSDNGRLYYVVAQRVHDLWISNVRTHLLWEAPTGAPGRRTLRLRSYLIPLRLSTVEGLDVAAIHHVGQHTDAVVVAGEGSSVASDALWAQFETHENLAHVIKRVVGIGLESSYSVGVSFVWRRRPHDLAGMGKMFLENLHPAVVGAPQNQVLATEHGPEELRITNLSRVADELFDITAQHGGDVTMASVWTIKRDTHLTAAAKRGSLPKSQLHRLLVAKVAQTAVDGLASCGIVDPYAMDLEDLQHFMRSAWDGKNLVDYHLQTQEGEITTANEAQWPTERIEAFRDHCLIDGTYHTVLRISNCPSEQLPHFFRELFAINAKWLTVTLVGETVSSRNEEVLLNRIIPIKEAFDEQRGIVHKSSRVLAREEARLERERRLFESRFGQAYNLLIAVSNTDLQTLEDDADEARRKCLTMGLSAKRITGENRQLPALWSATTGINML
ncbi:MAG TPA: hypothetical protein VHD60_02505 [Candidatus Saccharimonadales bacterium]|nr:hypothetical protein [Candidatus Saccharimonadales bacterium]